MIDEARFFTCSGLPMLVVSMGKPAVIKRVLFMDDRISPRCWFGEFAKVGINKRTEKPERAIDINAKDTERDGWKSITNPEATIYPNKSFSQLLIP